VHVNTAPRGTGKLLAKITGGWLVREAGSDSVVRAAPEVAGSCEGRGYEGQLVEIEALVVLE